MFEKGWFQFSKCSPASLLLALILIFYTLNGIYYLRSQSITFDEGQFLSFAARLVKGHPERIHPASDNSKMPVVVLNLFPRAISQLLHPGLKKTDNGMSDVLAGRYMTLLFSLFTILLVYRWSKAFYGIYAGLFSAFLISFCPNSLASAGLVTTDSYSAFFLTATLYCLWKFSQRPGLKFILLLSLFAGLSQLVKQSLTYLYLLIPLMLVIFYFIFKPVIKWRTVLAYTFLFLFVNWLVINLGFYFRGSNTRLGDYHFVSGTMLHLQQLLPAALPVPFPESYVTALDLSKYYDQLGGGDYLSGSYGKITILNQSSSTGFWYYYLVTLFYKTPVTFLILIFSSLILVIRRSVGKEFYRNEFFLLSPVLFFLIYMSLFYHTQIGIRQIIFIYPFLFILCGILIPCCAGMQYRRAVLILLSVFLMISVLRYRGNYYPYTNEFIGDKKMAYSYVGAANLEFNQGNNFFQKYLQQHPEVKMAGATPAPGIYLITANDYLDVWNLHQFDWLKQIKPFGQVAFNGLLIQVKPGDLKIPVKDSLPR